MNSHFLSFLGTGNYETCRYEFKGKISSPVPYIQLALLELLEELQDNQTKVSIFLTQKAREKHWVVSGNSSSEVIGLAAILKNRFPALTVEPIPIAEGRTAEELWNIFTIMYEQIDEGETLYIDITHSFRSLPIFGIALLNYARILKNIRVGGIYYGAFEAMGAPSIVKEIPLEKRIAPVFDLSGVYTLMEWSTAVHLFLQTGRAESLAYLVRTNLKPVLSDPGKRNLEAIGEQKLADMLNIVTLDLLTNRGEELRKGETFFRLQKIFSALQGKSLYLKPLEPLLVQIGEKFSGFSQNDTRNGYRGVEWCIQHGWIQQGITQLQETIITHMLGLLHENLKAIEKREIVSTVFDAKEKPGDPHAHPGYQDCLRKDPHLTKRIFDHPFCEVAAPPYNKLRKLRNDINHGGFVEDTPAQRFKLKLKEALEDLKKQYHERFQEELF